MFAHYQLGEVQSERFQYAEAASQYRAAVSVLDRMIAAEQDLDRSNHDRPILKRKADSAERAVEATVDWDEFVKLPNESQPALLALRCTEFARQKKYDKVSQAAEKLRSLANDAAMDDRASILYAAACGFGLCATGVRVVDGDSTEQKRRQEFVDKSMQCLHEAIEAG